MAGRFSSLGTVGLVVLTSCTFDMSKYTQTSGSGASGVGGAASTGTSTPTNASVGTTGSTPTSSSGAETTATSSTAGSTTAGSTTAATTTSTTTTSTTASTTNSSTASGGPTNLSFCGSGNPPKPIVDAFDGAAINGAVWNTSMGVFLVHATASDGYANLITGNGANNPASASLKATTAIVGECAVTVRLLQGTNGVARFRFDSAGGARIRWESGTAANSGTLNGVNNTDVQNVTLPITMAFVAHMGRLYAAYQDSGAMWHNIDDVQAPGGIDQAHVQLTEGDTPGSVGKYDDFNIVGVSLAELGL